MLLKKRSALSKKSKRWNYGFTTIDLRRMKGRKEGWFLQDISPLLIETFKSKRLNESVKPATVNKDLLIIISGVGG